MERQHQNYPDLLQLDTMLAKQEDVASGTGCSRKKPVQMRIDYLLARLEITKE